MTEFFKKIANVEIRNILAVISTLGTFILLYLLTIKPIPTENKDILYTSVGLVFGGALGAVFGFYFGASKTNPPVDNTDNSTVKP